jgi:hypothetical protein
MGAALALAIMLVVVVAGLSLALSSQGTLPQGGRPGRPVRPVRPPGASAHPGAAAPPLRRPAPRRRSPEPTVVPGPEPTVEPPVQEPTKVRRPGVEIEAIVVSVVDERTLGPVTRSRVAFPTPQARERCKVGGRLTVLYDPEHHRKVWVDVDRL